MNINSSNPYISPNSYSLKLNEKEMLVVDDDPQKKLLKSKDTKEPNKLSKPDELSKDEKRLVDALKSRDSEVKAHELAHQTAGGGMVGSATYSYQQAPDGKMYAIGGEVSVSMPSGGSTEERLANARTIASAASAVGDPSPQDSAVASQARAIEISATNQLAKEREATKSYNDNNNSFKDYKTSQNKVGLDIVA